MITTKEIEKLAELARIKIDDSEKAGLTKEIDSILSYVDQIKRATVDMDFKPTPGAVHNIYREDEVKGCTEEERQRLLDEAPNMVGEFIAVKKIISED
jgi:aspartyl-tRNA(Asn)/glutamyl-tRNA(Gln) amidotransferase subunit C